MHHLLLLPEELLAAVAHSIDGDQFVTGLNALARTCRGLNDFLTRELYLRDGDRDSPGMNWAAMNGRQESIQKAIDIAPLILRPRHVSAALENGFDGIAKMLLGVESLREELKLVTSGLTHLHDSEQQHKEMALWWAASGGFTEVARLILAIDGMDPLVVSMRTHSAGLSPLDVASQNGHFEMVQFFVDIQAVGRSNSPMVSNALYYASAHRHMDIAKLLLANGANPNESAWVAAQNGNSDILILLIENGADLEAATGLVSQMGDGVIQSLFPALLDASNAKVARILLNRGASVHETDDNGQTVLHKARDIDHIELLLDNDADIMALDFESESVLHHQIKENHADAVRLLLDQRGARKLIYSRNNTGQTPLHLAASLLKDDIITLLIDSRADIEAVSSKGLTPLLEVFWDDYCRWRDGVPSPTLNPIPQSLLDKGANVNAKLGNGLTPLHIASHCRSYGRVELLLQYGADPNISLSESQVYPLHSASRNGHVPTMELLVHHGADVNFVDAHGCTPLAMASRNPKAVEWLLEHGATPATADDQNRESCPVVDSEKGPDLVHP